MRLLPLLVAVPVLAFVGCEQETRTTQDTTPETVLAGAVLETTVEIGCLSCTYGMEGGCRPAVLIDGQPRLVSGVEVDLKAHELCSAPKQAVVSGTVDEETFVATKIAIQ